MSYRFSFDSLVVRDARVYGWGWYLDDAAPAHAIHLRLHLADGGVRDLRCTQFGSRPDLAQACPQLPHAAGGGFMLQVRLPATMTRAELHVELADGRSEVVALPDFPAAYVAPADAGSRAGRLWHLLRARQWNAARRRVVDRLAQLHAVAAPKIPAATSQRARWVVFDHAMGGGSNHFRNERVAGWRAAGHDVVVVSPLLSTLEYAIAGMDARGGSWQRRYRDLASCLSALGACDQMVINDLPSFDDPLQVLDWTQARRGEGARLLLYLHDFHAACPAWTLIDNHGRDCGIPGIGQCAKCLPANKGLFLGMMPSLDIVAWRRAWARVIARADEVVAFSASTVETLQRAFPDIDLRAKATVRPHDTGYLGPAPPPFQPTFGDIATIAVVGEIGEHKGARIVARMAEIIERERLPARIVVIGTIDGVDPSPALNVTGAYHVGELPGLLARERIAVAFLPSIVRETFSYVTAELMHYRVPLAVFDLGAPAERVRDYPLGCIISRIDARTALHELLSFQRALAAGHAGATQAGRER